MLLQLIAPVYNSLNTRINFKGFHMGKNIITIAAIMSIVPKILTIILSSKIIGL